jgi:hypothetical protein
MIRSVVLSIIASYGLQLRPANVLQREARLVERSSAAGRRDACSKAATAGVGGILACVLV